MTSWVIGTTLERAKVGIVFTTVVVVCELPKGVILQPAQSKGDRLGQDTSGTDPLERRLSFHLLSSGNSNPDSEPAER